MPTGQQQNVSVFPADFSLTSLTSCSADCCQNTNPIDMNIVQDDVVSEGIGSRRVQRRSDHGNEAEAASSQPPAPLPEIIDPPASPAVEVALHARTSIRFIHPVFGVGPDGSIHVLVEWHATSEAYNSLDDESKALVAQAYEAYTQKSQQEKEAEDARYHHLWAELDTREGEPYVTKKFFCPRHLCEHSVDPFPVNFYNSQAPEHAEFQLPAWKVKENDKGFQTFAGMRKHFHNACRGVQATASQVTENHSKRKRSAAKPFFFRDRGPRHICGSVVATPCCPGIGDATGSEAQEVMSGNHRDYDPSYDPWGLAIDRPKVKDEEKQLHRLTHPWEQRKLKPWNILN